MDFKAEAFDQLQSIFEELRHNDRTVRCVIRFSGKLDQDRLERAMSLLLEAAPILACRYVADERRAVWRSVEPAERGPHLVVTDDRRRFDDFTVGSIDPSFAPQVRACLFRAQTDSLCVVMNHMICDAAGFKEYLYALSGLYSRRESEAEQCDGSDFPEARNLKPLFAPLPRSVKVRAFFAGERRTGTQPRFPWAGGGELGPRLLTRELTGERLVAIRRYCADRDVTVNDVVMAAYFRAVHRACGFVGAVTLSIPLKVDMRKYLPRGMKAVLCNFSSMQSVEVRVDGGEPLDATVARVSAFMRGKKSGVMGLGGLLRLSFLFDFVGPRLARAIIKRGFSYPPTAFTNIGVVDAGRLRFQDCEIDGAFITGSTKYRPNFQVAVSTFRDSVVFSANLFCSAEDVASVEAFLDLLERELPGTSVATNRTANAS